MSASELLEQAKQLSVKERWELAHQLWDTLSDDLGVPMGAMPELSPSFIDEIQRRQQLVSSGRHVTYDADESMERVRKALEEFRRS